MDKIPGGYYLKARCIQESDISKAPPHIREIWDWFLMKANHREYKHLKRGQLLTTYKEIVDGLSWYVGYRKCQYSKSQCETAMKWLKKATMITTMKTTRGMIVSILNYDLYQNPKNYESHTETFTKTTTEPQWHDTTNKNGKNVKNTREGGLKRAKQIPSDFILSDPMQQYALSKGIPSHRIKSIFEQFLNHHKAKGSVMKDWGAAWRTWCLNEYKFSKAKGRGVEGSVKGNTVPKCRGCGMQADNIIPGAECPFCGKKA